MPTTSTNYGLALYNATTDQAENFQNFRLALAGNGVGSNMNLIDAALKGLADDIATLELDESLIYVDANLSGSAATATVSGIASYALGLLILLTLDVTITGTTTLNINALGAKSLMRIDQTNTAVNLVSGELQVGTPYIFRYDGTRFVWVGANQGQMVQVNGSTASRFPALNFVGASLQKIDAYPAVQIDIDGSIWYKNIETLSGTRTILDTDYPMQILNPNGATRLVNLPAVNPSNKIYFITNTSSSASYLLDVRYSSVTVATIEKDETLGFISNGLGTWRTISVDGYATLLTNLGTGYKGFSSTLTTRLNEGLTDAVNVVNALGNIVLTSTDVFVQAINPGAASRNVTLPALASGNHGFLIIHSGSSTSYTLAVKNPSAVTIATVVKDEACLFVSDGTTWRQQTVAGYQQMATDLGTGYKGNSADLGTRMNGFQDAASSTTTTAAGTVTLTDASKAIQFINTGGASRDVNLPANANTNHDFWIYNSASTSGEFLTIKTSAGQVLSFLPPQRMSHFVSDGTNWVTDGNMYAQMYIQNMKPTLTAGCAASAQIEMATNKNVYDYLAFDASTIEYAYFNMVMPDDYDYNYTARTTNASFWAQFYWTHPATTVNFGVSWGLSGVSINDNTALDVAQGTPQYANDVGGTTSRFYRSPITNAITVSGTLGIRSLINFRISRMATDATNDTLAVDAYLLGVTVWYKTS